MASRSGNLKELLQAGKIEYTESHDARPAGIRFELEGGGAVQVVGDEDAVVALEFGDLIKVAKAIIKIVGDMMDDGGAKPEGSGDGSGGGGGGGKTIIITGGNNTIIIQ